MANDKVTIELTLEQKQAIKALRETGLAVTNFADKAEKKMSGLSQAFTVFGGVTLAGVVSRGFHIFTRAIGDAIEESRDFEKSLLEIQTILPKNVVLTDKLKNSLTDLSVEFATSRQKQAKAFYQIISAGITDTVEAEKALIAANKLALGGLADLNGSINILTDVLNVYKDSNITAEEASDILFTTVQKGKTTVEELQSSIGNVLPSANNLGVSFKDVSATLALLTTRGQSTSENVTQLTSLFTALIKNQKIAKKVLGANAEQFSLLALKTKGLDGFLKDINTTIGGSSQKWLELLGRKEALNAVLKLSQDNFVGLKNTMKDFNVTTGASTKASEELKKGLDFKLKQLDQNINVAGASLVNTLTPALIAATDAANNFILALRGRGKSQIADAIVNGIAASSPALGALVTALLDTEKAIEDVQSTALDGLLGPVDIDNVQAQLQGAQKELKGLQELMELGEVVDPLRVLEVQSRISALQAQVNSLVGQLPSGAGGADPIAAAEERDKKLIEQEKKLQSEIAKIKEEAILKEEENRLLRKEFTDKDDINNLNALTETLGAEQAVKLQARENIAAQEQNARLRELKLEQANAAERVAIQIKLNKDLLATDKLRRLQIQQSLNATANLLTAFGQLAGESGAEVFALQKALALATIPINIAQGIMQAQTLIPPASWIQTAAVIATGAAQLMAVSNQRPPGKQFGGIVDGGGGQTGDNNIIGVNDREMLLNRRQQDELFNAINQGELGGGGGVNIVVNGDILAEDSFVDKLAEKLSDAVEFRNVTLRAS